MVRQWNQTFDTRQGKSEFFYTLHVNPCRTLLLENPRNETQNNPISPKRGRKPITRNICSGYPWYHMLFSMEKIFRVGFGRLNLILARGALVWPGFRSRRRRSRTTTILVGEGAQMAGGAAVENLYSNWNQWKADKP